MPENYLLIIGLAVFLGVFLIIVGVIFGQITVKKKRDKEWLLGKKEASKSFESIWDDQKREFRATVTSLEKQINRRMHDAVEQSRTAGEPILSDLRALLNKAQSPDQLPSGGKGTNSNDDDNSLKPPITRVK